jgi:hypothetical protein
MTGVGKGFIDIRMDELFTVPHDPLVTLRL